MALSCIRGGGGLHVAIIMDGNGRWAVGRGRPRTFGHRQGARAVREVVRAAPSLGIDTLTLYAFSSDNWSRPPTEVTALMGLCRRYLEGERAECMRNGVRVNVIGRRDRLAASLVRAIEAVEKATADCTRLRLRIAVDYSARDALVEATSRLALSSLPPSRENLASAMADAIHDPLPLKDVDLLVRTGAERRLSDFLLWECAYAEFLFTPTLWPDFGKDELAAALDDFRKRERRFGALPAPVTRPELANQVRSA